MSAIEIFTFGGREIRVASDPDGEPWFVAADVAQILEYSSTPAMVRSIDEEDRAMRILHTPSGTQEMTVLNESGLWSAILGRQKARVTDPAAKAWVGKVKRWVTSDLIPTVRKTGSYGVPAQREPEQFALPQTLSQALRAYATEVEAREAADQRAIEAEAKVVELAPAANAWNAVVAAKGTCSVGELSKMLANVGIMIGPNNLFKKLAEMNVIYRKGYGDNAYWEAYSEHVQAGRMTMKGQSRPEYDDGEVIGRKDANDQVRFKPKGLEYIIGRLTNELLVQPMLELVSGGAR